jgi:hypothetical protein
MIISLWLLGLMLQMLLMVVFQMIVKLTDRHKHVGACPG